MTLDELVDAWWDEYIPWCWGENGNSKAKTDVQLIDWSIRKWRGLRRDEIRRFVRKFSGIDGVREDDITEEFRDYLLTTVTHTDTCPLCVRYYNYTDSACRDCPLQRFGMGCRSELLEEDDSNPIEAPYTKTILTSNVSYILRALKAARRRLIARKR